MAKKKSSNEFENLSWWIIFAAYWGILALISLIGPLFGPATNFVSGTVPNVVLNGLLAVAIYKKNVLAFWLGFIITGYHLLIGLISYFSISSQLTIPVLQDLFIRALPFFIALMLWLKTKHNK